MTRRSVLRKAWNGSCDGIETTWPDIPYREVTDENHVVRNQGGYRFHRGPYRTERAPCRGGAKERLRKREEALDRLLRGIHRRRHSHPHDAHRGAPERTGQQARLGPVSPPD